MPQFPYKCTECNHEFIDLILNMTDKPKDELDCPECGKVAKKESIYSFGMNGTVLAWQRTDSK